MSVAEAACHAASISHLDGGIVLLELELLALHSILLLTPAMDGCEGDERAALGVAAAERCCRRTHLVSSFGAALGAALGAGLPPGPFARLAGDASPPWGRFLCFCCCCFIWDI